ncbi:SDR family oxidoreductase [Dictyobacter arantiisoli]|uniref:GDP-mannose 4,6-dehydratase n=1 Tax=Dictyobacter arantiisoli TaxID=2014874 RepID=A0A5A5TB33_9CHLR|nr:SDR family oxidoreductase [Dictyobacter arantiisoli]GCF08223.1 GDP-mannose 4,6-dehydratase [Dictyobacter arantiisoli]
MMRNSRYLVTGGAGFIGSHIAATLLKQGEAVRIIDDYATGRVNNQNAFETMPGQFEIINGDIRDLETLKQAAQGVEVIFHQAALASVPRSIADPISSLEVNINGTQNVLIAARDSKVRRVVFASSSSVYGNTPTLPKHEEMPTAPMSPYAVHKLTGEHLCSVFTRIYGLETVALRYFNVFGPRQDPKSEYAAVIPRFLTALINKTQPIVFGDGEQTRDFTYVDNVVQANLKAATAPHASGQAMNIGCGERISLNEVLKIAGELLETTIHADYRDARPGDVRDSLADISKAQRLLGFDPTVKFATGLALTLEALRAGTSETK